MKDHNLLEAARRIRKELIIKDQPLTAFNFLTSLNLSELEPDRQKTLSMIRHIFDHKFYIDYHTNNLPEFPEPQEICIYIDTKYPRFKWMIEKFEQEKIKTVLDLGCADGAFCLTLGNKGYKATGVNLKRESIQTAASRVRELNVKNVNFIVDDLSNINQRADAVVISELIEHVANPIEIVKHAVFLADKWVFLTTPNGAVQNGQGNLPDWDCKGPDDIRGHVRVYNRKLLEELLKDYEIGEIKEEDNLGANLLYAMFRNKK